MTNLWLDGDHDPGENMRRDSGLLAVTESDPHATATLRLFRFRPHGITLGRNQRPETALDLERCARDGVGWAVRPTGGRAIFHAQEWTYSLAARLDDPVWGGSLTAAYAAISQVIVASLRRLGVPAELAAGHRGAEARAAATSPCFASTARHEVVLAGRKLVGSAQRRTATALLQQGSVLLGPGHLRLADYLAIDDAERPAVRARLAAAATDAGGVLGMEAPIEHWAEALAEVLPGGVGQREPRTGALRLTLFETPSYTARSLATAPHDSPGDAR